MEAAELDVALEELETRLERLRALYEQYFMGLEKIEPAIARKDVDRRIYVLRREKIRNTAKRFKLQTIIQRYNTFQQYWQRICREIENGTYKRHLLRAQKQNPNQLLTIAARKRLGRQANQSQPPEGAAENAAGSQPPTADAAPSTPPAVEAPPPIAAAPSPAAARPAGSPPLPPRRPPLPGRPAPEATPASAAPVVPPVPVAAAPATPIAAKPTASPKPAPAKFESLDLDMDFMGDWDPGARSAPAKPAAPAKAAADKPAAAPARPAPPVVKPAPPVAAAPKPPPAPVGPKAPVPALPAGARAAVESVRPVAAPPRPLSSRPPTVPIAPRIPAAPRLPTAASPPIPARPAPKPAPQPAPAAPKPAAAPAPKPAPAAASASVDDARLRDLHSRLQQAKQQTKEANVSFEGLAKSIRATEAKLREQHKNRKIEFDVVIKDGKAVVKPIVR